MTDDPILDAADRAALVAAQAFERTFREEFTKDVQKFRDSNDDQAALAALLIEAMDSAGDYEGLTVGDLLDDLATAGLLLKRVDEATGNPASEAYMALTQDRLMVKD